MKKISLIMLLFLLISQGIVYGAEDISIEITEIESNFSNHGQDSISSLDLLLSDGIIITKRYYSEIATYNNTTHDYDVKDLTLYYLSDKNGKNLYQLSNSYDTNTRITHLGPFINGLAVICSDDKWGYIDKSGKIQIPLTYENARDFSGGLAAVKTTDGWGYINTNGEMVVPFKYYDAGDFIDGLANVRVKPDYIDDYSVWKWESINKLGEKVSSIRDYTPTDKKDIFSTINSMSNFNITASNDDLIPIKENDKYGYKDKDGNIVIPLLNYSYISRPADHLIVAEDISGENYLIDKTGKVIKPVNYKDVFKFSKDIYIARSYDTYWDEPIFYLIDSEGNEIIPQSFAKISDQMNGYIIAYSGNSYENNKNNPNKKSTYYILKIHNYLIEAPNPNTDITIETTLPYQMYADSLNSYGLFSGTDKGYELDRNGTRLEGLVMFLRLIGEDKDALNSTSQHPFTDVPHWADRYVAYAYSKGYTSGVDNTTFGSNLTINAKSYFTFLLRALGYSDKSGDFNWNESLEFANSIGLLSDSDFDLYQSEFLRAQIVKASYDALFFKNKHKTLFDTLTESGKILD